ncbi:MAG: MFS transporter [Dehalococcoidales bacterium]|nr:MFS transporter [Dehalococcoidales bacterium]
MKKYLIFAVVSIGMLMAAISTTVVAVAFPQIVSAFDTTLIVAGWVFSVSQVAATAGMPLIGKISDAYGSKITFIMCIILFTVGSLLCAIAPNIILLIVFRLIQGLGIGGLLPVGTSVIAEEFSSRRQQYIGFLSSVYAIGTIFGPNLGGWLVTAFGWQSSFWIFVPFGILILIAIIILLPKNRGKASKLDLVGAGFLMVIISTFLAGISLMGNTEQGIPWTAVGLLFAAGVVLIIIFMRRQVRVINPIIDVEILQEKRFLAANVLNFILGLGLFAITSFIPLYAITIFGMSTFESGLIMTPRSIGVLIASALVSISLLRWGYRQPMVIGTIVTAATVGIMAIVNPETTIFGWQMNSFVLLGLILLVNGVAQGITLPAANNACIELMPERVGTITGVRGMFRQVGGAIGIATMTLALHNSSSIEQGFFLVLIGIGVLMLFSLPLIYMVPKNASVEAFKKTSRRE